MTSEDLARSKSPGPAPEFMIDLYNTVTDSFGVTRAKNPYNAHIVRSFMERGSGNSRNDYFYFNVSGLEDTETVLEAELHVHRSPTPHDQLHPSLYLTPFYILSLYAVVDTNNLEIPDLHQLLGVHYVPALGSGWEVFNVKQSVLKWLNNGHANNHGFLVAATSLGGDRVPVKFARRGEKVDNKQPILVLFTEDSKLKEEAPEPVMMMVKQAPKMAKPEKSGNGTGSETNSEETQHIPLSSKLMRDPKFFPKKMHQILTICATLSSVYFGQAWRTHAFTTHYFTRTPSATQIQSIASDPADPKTKRREFCPMMRPGT